MIPILLFVIYGISQNYNNFGLFLDNTFADERDLGLMFSYCIWVYSGFISLGMIAGEVKYPKNVFITSVLILIPMAILLNTFPILISLSIESDTSKYDIGYVYQLIQKITNGNWLQYLYIVGCISCQIGLYNAQIISAQESFAYFIEQNSKEINKLNITCLKYMKQKSVRLSNYNNNNNGTETSFSFKPYKCKTSTKFSAITNVFFTSQRSVAPKTDLPKKFMKNADVSATQHSESFADENGDIISDSDVLNDTIDHNDRSIPNYRNKVLDKQNDRNHDDFMDNSTITSFAIASELTNLTTNLYVNPNKKRKGMQINKRTLSNTTFFIENRNEIARKIYIIINFIMVCVLILVPLDIIFELMVFILSIPLFLLFWAYIKSMYLYLFYMLMFVLYVIIIIVKIDDKNNYSKMNDILTVNDFKIPCGLFGALCITVFPFSVLVFYIVLIIYEVSVHRDDKFLIPITCGIISFGLMIHVVWFCLNKFNKYQRKANDYADNIETSTYLTFNGSKTKHNNNTDSSKTKTTHHDPHNYRPASSNKKFSFDDKRSQFIKQ